MSCFFGHKKLICVGVNHVHMQKYYGDHPFGESMASTVATMKCPKCGYLEVRNLFSAGFITAEQINEMA